MARKMASGSSWNRIIGPLAWTPVVRAAYRPAWPRSRIRHRPAHAGLQGAGPSLRPAQAAQMGAASRPRAPRLGASKRRSQPFATCLTAHLCSETDTSWVAAFVIAWSRPGIAGLPPAFDIAPAGFGLLLAVGPRPAHPAVG